MLLEIARRLPPPAKSLIKRVAGYRGRKAIAMAYYGDTLARINDWASRDKETSNFYYDLTPLNREHLAHTISLASGQTVDAVFGYFAELDNDVDLRRHLKDGLSSSTYGKDIEIEFGRRLGWYAIARALKPSVLIETGVDHGVGSCVLASALLRNAADGHPGRYYGTDIRPEAGQLFAGKYASAGEILYGDSISSLEKFAQPIDLFINDSDHSGEYEYREYQVIKNKMSARGVILGDNSHVTDALSRFSREAGRKFFFFSEKPKDHWYPGAGIGISLPA